MISMFEGFVVITDVSRPTLHMSRARELKRRVSGRASAPCRGEVPDRATFNAGP